MAFEFSVDSRCDIVRYLRKREGPGFIFPIMKILFENGTEGSAIVPIYTKNDVMEGSLEQLAAKANLATGENGKKCTDYVQNIAKKLTELGIDDPEVSAFRDALNSSRSGSP